MSAMLRNVPVHEADERADRAPIHRVDALLTLPPYGHKSTTEQALEVVTHSRLLHAAPLDEYRDVLRAAKKFQEQHDPVWVAERAEEDTMGRTNHI
jgi:hypothetical protein